VAARTDIVVDVVAVGEQTHVAILRVEELDLGHGEPLLGHQYVIGKDLDLAVSRLRAAERNASTVLR
jgi:hypothetical protein